MLRSRGRKESDTTERLKTSNVGRHPGCFWGPCRLHVQDVGLNVNASSSVNQPGGRSFTGGGIDWFFRRGFLEKCCFIHRLGGNGEITGMSTSFPQVAFPCVNKSNDKTSSKGPLGTQHP